MAKIALEIGGLNFPSKTAATTYFRQMRDRYQVGDRIVDPDATELSWLLERHPEFRDKVGVGIDYFSVRSADFGTRCFEIVRKDGSSTDFSFGTCIDGKAPSPLSEAIAALRAEVTEDILQKKREWFRERGDAEGKVACALTGRSITIDEAHADHAPPRTFGTLAVAFIEARGIDPSVGFVTAPADNQYQPKLRDEALAQQWRDYHHKLAVIRIVAKGANLTRAHEGKVKTRDKQLQL